MKKILFVYYSRTGNTKKVAEDVQQALGAELLEIKDDVVRSGFLGYLRCGLDSMRKNVQPVQPFVSEYALGDYDLVIVATPVWAGRCSSVIRSFLKEFGHYLPDTAFLLTRGSEERYESVFSQMDLYIKEPHKVGGSVRVDSVGYEFWRDEFLKDIRLYFDKPQGEE